MKNRINLLLIIAISVLSLEMDAQGSMNTDKTAPDASAILDVKRTEKGGSTPRMTTAQRNSISSPAEGLVIYGTDNKSLYLFNGTLWKNTIGHVCGNPLEDVRDGEVYQTVLKGTQCWMAENLNIGTMIVSTTNQTNNSTFEKYCYGNNTSNCDTYGGLYQWDEMMQYVSTKGARGICPTGWHLPTDSEWKTLERYLGMSQSQADTTDFRGTDEGSQLAGNEPLWSNGLLDQNANFGTSGFTGLPGGSRDTYGSFNNLAYGAYFWSSSEYGTDAKYRALYYTHAQEYRNDDSKANGFSVRCLIANTTQVAINTDGTIADVSSMLDINSTTKGILIPRLTLTQRNTISSPATGLMVYQSDNTPGFYYYNGSSWAVVGTEAVDINSLADGKTDGNSVFLGTGAGANNNGTDNKNVSVGYNALFSNTNGVNNTANGFYALYSNTTGGYNTANGSQALFYNTTGGYNTANGNFALFNNASGNNNTAFGYNTLYSNSAGTFNIANGFGALYSNTTGGYNTANGSQALYNNIGGDGNTANGVQALYSYSYSNSGSHGNTANGVCAHCLGNGIQNTSTGSLAFYSSEGSLCTAIGRQATSNTVNYSNTTAVGYSAEPTASNRIHIGNTSVQWIGGQTTWSTYSDSRAKNNIKEDVKGLDFIMKLRPLSWYWDKNKLDTIMGITDSSDYKEKYDIEKIKQNGFLVHEVEKAAMESGYDFSGIHTPVNDHTPYSLSYAEFVVPLVKAVQERQKTLTDQQQMIEMLQETIKNQQGMIEVFQDQNKVLVKRIEKLEAEYK